MYGTLEVDKVGAGAQEEGCCSVSGEVQTMAWARLWGGGEEMTRWSQDLQWKQDQLNLPTDQVKGIGELEELGKQTFKLFSWWKGGTELQWSFRDT